MNDYPKITYKKHTFFSALVMGLALIIITLIISGTVLIIYGMHFAGEKSEKIMALVEEAVQGMPMLQKSLPPVFADMLTDRRQPEYSAQLEITAKTAPEQDGRLRTSISVVNKGEEVVSLLSMRIVVLDSQGQVLAESNEWAATPFAAEDDWPGPLMPGSHRYLTCTERSALTASGELKTQVEISDVRLWSGRKDVPATETPKLPEKEKSAPAASTPAAGV